MFPNQTAAWAAAAGTAGRAPAIVYLVAQQLRRGELSLAEVQGTRRPTAGTPPCWNGRIAAPAPARYAAS